jgi:hypothetical protein
MDFPHWLLLFYAALVFYVLGVTCFVQLVVYPLFAQVGLKEYVTYHKFYLGRIPLPVVFPGFSCFLLPLAIIILRPESVPLWIAIANAACGILALFVTVALEIPRHDWLEAGGKQTTVIRELIRYNWPRLFGVFGSACFTGMMITLAFLPA